MNIMNFNEYFNLNTLKIFSSIIGLLLLIDIPMITLINKKMYQDNLKNINYSDINFTTLKIISAILCYLIVGGGIYYFSVKENSTLNALVLGLVVYGVYNTTNYATLNNYSLKVAAIDTLWGTTLFTIIGFVIIKIFNNSPVSEQTTSDNDNE